ncbi:hypothetical protein BDA99DRAFT_493173 [Phascolomyces articulosus]|uniref:Uncharacterized protein n=1 Tax=Phascolomyces articulosus TaxID=60185 RepID=A0AAD5KS85_9FUNG|nr:hypothetical protein BDA99DRAFT_493173 [Phascolomyces articulosus]
METCVVSYTPSHHSGNETPPSPTTSSSSNLDNDHSETTNTTTITPTSNTITTTTTTSTETVDKTTNMDQTSLSQPKQQPTPPQDMMIHTPPTSPTSSRRINQLHRRLSRYPSTTLSDLIPAATAALKASQQLKKEQERQVEDQEPDAVMGSSALSRALTKVRIQVQTKRLKEKYLTYEWVRLALSLPVDESIINNSQYPLPPMKKKKVDPEQLLQEQKGNTMLTREEKDDDGNTIRMVALKNYKGRTGEIATWYEWKFDKSKFTMEQVESRVDRLRTRIQQIKHIAPDPTTTNKPTAKMLRASIRRPASAVTTTTTTTTSTTTTTVI